MTDPMSEHCVRHACKRRELEMRERIATLESALAEARRDGERPIVRHNDDGTLDEVVGVGHFHLEQMDTNAWWMQLGPHMVNLTARGKITAHFGENEASGVAAIANQEPNK